MHVYADRLTQNGDSKVDVIFCDAHWRLNAKYLQQSPLIITLISQSSLIIQASRQGLGVRAAVTTLLADL